MPSSSSQQELASVAAPDLDCERCCQQVQYASQPLSIGAEPIATESLRFSESQLVQRYEPLLGRPPEAVIRRARESFPKEQDR